MLLYSDDFLMTAGTQSEMMDLAVVLLLWVALGVPWKWKKFRGGFKAEWIGYHVDFDHYVLGISPRRADWLACWCERTVREKEARVEDLRAVMGRLVFALGALEYLRPFCAPILSWVAVAGRGGLERLPWSVLFLLAYISEQLRGGYRVQKVRPHTVDLGPLFRADAKAEGQEVAIGGWECAGGCPPGKARWFRLSLTRQNAAWAFCRGEPFRTIAPIELFATLISLVVFGPKWRAHTRGRILLSGQINNLGNVSVLSRMMSSKFPLIVIMTELAERLRDWDLDMGLDWIPRNQNEEADGLTNGMVSPFSAELEVKVDLKDLGLKTLERMWPVADDLYKEVLEKKALSKEKGVASLSGATTMSSPRSKAKPLRERDPW